MNVVSYPSFNVLIKCSAIFFLSLFLFTSCSNKNQVSSNLRIYSLVDTTIATIGDKINIQVWVKGATNHIIQFPNWELENENIAVKKTGDLKGETYDEYGVEFQFTFWDTGSFEVSPYSVEIMKESGDQVDFLISTDPIPVTIQSVIKEDQPKLRDIKQPVPIPVVLPWREIVSIGSILILMGLLVWLWRKRTRLNDDDKIQYTFKRHPFDIAIEKLGKLQSQPLFTPLQIKDYYIELSLIVREFIENQFFIRAIEMTTSEINLAKDLIPADGQSVSNLMEVLQRADLTKFAKYQPDIDQCEVDLESIKSFIAEARIEWSAITPSPIVN